MTKRGEPRDASLHRSPSSEGEQTWIDEEWIDEENAACEFRDERLKKRFRVLLQQFWNGTGQTIPLACQDWASTKAAYRLLANDHVCKQDILSGHFQATWQRFEGSAGPILILPDTTTFSYQRDQPEQIGGLLPNSPRFCPHPHCISFKSPLTLWRESRTDVDSLSVFQGPQTYISPSMYPSKAATGKVVPTWNYIMVQGRGRLHVVDDAHWLRAFVTRLSERHEAARPVPWAVSDAAESFIDATLRAIVGIEITLCSLRGKWKVSQNRTRFDRDGVVYGLRSQGGAEAEAMARAVAERIEPAR